MQLSLLGYEGTVGSVPNTLAPSGSHRASHKALLTSSAIVDALTKYRRFKE